MVACLGMPVARSVIHVVHRADQHEKVPIRRDEQVPSARFQAGVTHVARPAESRMH